jgi:hypothetical protein
MHGTGGYGHCFDGTTHVYGVGSSPDARGGRHGGRPVVGGRGS